MAKKLNENLETPAPEEVNSDDIIMDEESAMPQPESKSYEQTFKLTEKFMGLFNTCVLDMPYASTLQNQQGNKIKLIDLVKFTEAKKDGIALNDLNTILAFIASAPFKYVRPLMEIVESKERQHELFYPVN